MIDDTQGNSSISSVLFTLLEKIDLCPNMFAHVSFLGTFDLIVSF